MARPCLKSKGRKRKEKEKKEEEKNGSFILLGVLLLWRRSRIPQFITQASTTGEHLENKWNHLYDCSYSISSFWFIFIPFSFYKTLLSVTLNTEQYNIFEVFLKNDTLIETQDLNKCNLMRRKQTFALFQECIVT